MTEIRKTEKRLSIPKDVAFILFLGLLYILLPSTNNSLDSLAYAEEMRSGSYLFRPHHLLYNAFGYVLAHLLNIKDTLLLMCPVNSMFAVACLFLMRSMLRTFIDERHCAVLLVLVGSCFGFIRFATDNEAYIIPLFFSLWASCIALKKKNTFLISLLGAIACLFHQVYFFWWLGLLFLILLPSEKTWVRKLTQYFLGALIVPITYLLVFHLTRHDSSDLLTFVFHDYFQTANVKAELKPIALLLTPISFIRSFLQVHGYFVPLIQKYPVIAIAALISLFCFILSIIKMRGAVLRRSTDVFSKRFASIHLLIFLMQFIFAGVSDGNAEFMVMLPFAFTLFFFIRYKLRLCVSFYIAAGLLIWNLFLGLIPSHFMKLDADFPMSRFIAEHPSNVYFLKDRIRIDNILNYYYPDQHFIIGSLSKGASTLDSLMSRNHMVITDIVNNPVPFSRASMVHKEEDQNLFRKYLLEKRDSIVYDLGILHITAVMDKQTFYH